MRTEISSELPFKAVGIVNLHPLFTEHFYRTLPPNLVRQLAHKHMNGARYYPDPKDNFGLSFLPDFRPLKRGGMIAHLDKTGYFQLLHGRHQLSLHPNIPASNRHTRADHSLLVIDQMIAQIDSFLDGDPETFVGIQENDFKEAGLMDGVKNEKELIILGARVGSLIGYLHDLYTVAGGERIKSLIIKLGINADEESLARQVLFPSTKGLFNKEPFISLNDNLRRTISRWGISDKHLDFAIHCIEGKSGSLLGRLINPPQDVLDVDRIGYTLLDNYSAKVFSADLPNSMVSDINDPKAQRRLINGLETFKELLANPEKMVSLDGDSEGFEPVFSWNTLDPSSSARLTKDGEIVYTNPSQMLALALVRAYGFGFYYYGAMMQGMEHQLKQSILQYIQRRGGEVPAVLQLPYLLSHTDTQLIKALAEFPDPQITEVCGWILNETLPPMKFSAEYVSKKRLRLTEWFRHNLDMKYGLDTKVDFKGEVISLNRYMNSNPHNALVLQGQLVMGMLSDKAEIITPKKGGPLALQPRLI